MAEFALLALPMSLVFAVAMAYCLNVYFDSVLRFEAIGAARFAALADVTVAEAESHARSACLAMPALIGAQCRVGISAAQGFAVSEFSYTPLAMFTLTPRRVTIDAAASLEIAK